MKKYLLMSLCLLLFTACTPGIGIGLPLGPIGFVGVGVNKDGLHPSAGVHAGPVGVGVDVSKVGD